MTKTKQLCSKCLDNGVKSYEPCEHDFNLDKAQQINTPEEARQFAIDWQNWASEQNLSYSELAEWNEVFTELATRFDLTEEFLENGII